MSISESQLKEWSFAPESTKIQQTHEQIREALKESHELMKHKYEIYLQGSYANSTNIRADSDVDVVAQLNSTFYKDINGLSQYEKELFLRIFPDATYRWADFRRDVMNALISCFGSTSVKQGNKSIKLEGNKYRVNADVVPCLQYRKYRSFSEENYCNFVEGMKFWTTCQRPNREIVNFPKVHLENGQNKNIRTSTMYKGLVRVVKNIKRQLIENYALDPGTAPSYFIECILYNVPDNYYFQNNFKMSLEMAYDFILRRCDLGKLITVSHQHFLFGTEPWQWNLPDAKTFFDTAEKFYLSN